VIWSVDDGGRLLRDGWLVPHPQRPRYPGNYVLFWLPTIDVVEKSFSCITETVFHREYRPHRLSFGSDPARMWQGLTVDRVLTGRFDWWVHGQSRTALEACEVPAPSTPFASGERVLVQLHGRAIMPFRLFVTLKGEEAMS